MIPKRSYFRRWPSDAGKPPDAMSGCLQAGLFLVIVMALLIVALFWLDWQFRHMP